MALLQSRVNELKKTNEALTKRKLRKRKYIQSKESLTVDEASQLIPLDVASAQKVSRESSNGVRLVP